MGWRGMAMVVALAMVGFLAAAGLVIWLYGVALPASHRRTVDWQRSDNRRWAAQVQQRLVAAAADGTLSDADLDAALGRKWIADRGSEQQLTVVAEHTGTDEGRLCYTYVLPLPLGPQVQVTRTESRQCPVIPARR